MDEMLDLGRFHRALENLLALVPLRKWGGGQENWIRLETVDSRKIYCRLDSQLAILCFAYIIVLESSFCCSVLLHIKRGPPLETLATAASNSPLHALGKAPCPLK